MLKSSDETDVDAMASSIYAPVRRLYVAQALASHASSLLMTGIFFYTQRQFRWELKQNLLMACGAGVIYVTGALSAGRLSERFGRRNLVLCLDAVLFALIATALAMPRSLVVAAVLITYNGLSAAAWPAFESLVSDGASGEALAKRLAMYNLVWSATNAVSLAVCGTIIEFWPNGLFVVAAVAQVFSAVVVRYSSQQSLREVGGEEESGSSPVGSEPGVGVDGSDSSRVALSHEAVLAPEPELLRVRTEALWLSRVALPSTYVVVYSLSAMLPSLPVMQPLSTRWRTVVGCVWFAARWGAFLVLGATKFWHTRPRLMLAATAVMLVAFLGTTVRPSDLFAGAASSPGIDVLSMVLWQILLGASLGIIYSASLYFGMVLSEGSTEHGGYHEALIGMGCVLGPGAAAVGELFYPGRLSVSIAAVAGLIAISLAAAVAAAVVARRRSRSAAAQFRG